MPEALPRERTRSAERFTFNELLWAQQQETNKRLDRVESRMDKLESKLESTRQELNARMDRQDARMDRIEEKIDRLADKIDDLHKEIKSSANHGQIANISTIGIALAVIYSLLR